MITENVVDNLYFNHSVVQLTLILRLFIKTCVISIFQSFQMERHETQRLYNFD